MFIIGVPERKKKNRENRGEEILFENAFKKVFPKLRNLSF